LGQHKRLLRLVEKGCSPGRQIFVPFSKYNCIWSRVLSSQHRSAGVCVIFFVSSKIKGSPIPFFYFEDNHEIHFAPGQEARRNSIHIFGDPTAIRNWDILVQYVKRLRFPNVCPPCTFLRPEGRVSIREWMTAFHVLYQIQQR
jgi:hypothetical protein